VVLSIISSCHTDEHLLSIFFILYLLHIDLNIGITQSFNPLSSDDELNILNKSVSNFIHIYQKKIYL